MKQKNTISNILSLLKEGTIHSKTHVRQNNSFIDVSLTHNFQKKIWPSPSKPVCARQTVNHGFRANKL